jgi:hypothetical protein
MRLLFDKLLSWSTTAFDTFALGAALAMGLKLLAPEASDPGFLQSAWMCIGIAAACWAVMVGVAAAHARLAPGAAQALQISDVRTAEREGQDGVYFCLDRPGGKEEFILSRGALEGLIDGDFPTRESMLLAFEIYRERIARTAAGLRVPAGTAPTLLTASAFFPLGMRDSRQAGVNGLAAPRFS